MRSTALAIFCTLVLAPAGRAQSTGTFIDRHAPTDLRVVSYNVLFDTIFTDTNPVQAAKFARVMTALQPEIVNLQEIYNHSAAQVASLMNSILPLGGGATWYAHKGSDNVIVSKYPLMLPAVNTSPASPRSIAIALVDLPNAQFATDFYFMNNHFRCCGSLPTGRENTERQRQADALVRWMSDARTSGGSIALADDTPMAVVGDLNIVQGLVDPLNTLLSGNILDEGTYGPDSPPDWDGSSLADAHPLHNGVGPADYTWRNDRSSFAPGRLDYVLYTDSVARTANQFVLNTVDMTAAELTATGMQTYDIVIDRTPLFPLDYDHLPLVIDFRFPADGSPGDYNLDRIVDAQDYELWQETYGSASNRDADGSRNNVVDAADYVVWRKFADFGGGSLPVPEPASNLLLVLFVSFAGIRQARDFRRVANQ